MHQVDLLPPSVRARLREGSYTTQQNGKRVSVSVTDGDTLKDAADLQAVIEGEFKGTKSAAAEGIKEIVGVLQSGAPLSDMQWATFHRLRDKYASQLATFRASPDSNIEGWVPVPPTGAGRIQEAGLLLRRQLRVSLEQYGRLREQYATPSTTTKDKATTPPHLLDSVLHDLGHSSQHVKRLLDADVRGNKQSQTFNIEHAINHLDSAVEHAKKLDAHLAQHPADPKVWTVERKALNAHRAMSEAAGPQVPPNFEHPAKGPHHCSECVFYASPQRCEKFNAKVDAGDWCSAFEATEATREAATPREDSGKFMRGSRTYDPLLLNADGGHAAEAAARLLDEGRIRVAGQSEATQQAVDDLTRRVGDKATVKTMAVQGNPSTQMKATREAATWPQRLAILREASDKIATEQVAADPAAPLLHKPRIAVDFDGVIHMGGHGMPGEVEGLPVPGVQAALKELAKRYDVIVLTARQDFAAVRKWLQANGMNDSVSQVTNVKPEALAYIDDRAVHFAGDWKAAVAAVDPARPVSQPIQLKKAFEAAAPLGSLLPSALRRLREYSDDQPRDDHGRWTGGGGGGASSQDSNSAQLVTLQGRWGALNAKLGEFTHSSSQLSPEAQGIIDQEKSIEQQMHSLAPPPPSGQQEGVHDVVVIGGGPAGLQSSIYASSEGLDTVMLEEGDRPGGQAGYSSRIENLLGFPTGTTGAALAQDGMTQAERFGTDMRFNAQVAGMSVDDNGVKTLTLADGSQVQAQSVIVAGGVQPRELGVPGEDGPGVSYLDAQNLSNNIGSGGSVVIVGAANSAGQAAIYTANQTTGDVTILSRSGNIDGMSSYLPKQIAAADNISVRGGSIATINRGNDSQIYSVTLKDGTEIPTNGVGVFIGSTPHTEWASGAGIETTGTRAGPEGGFIKTGQGGSYLSTNVPGVYAVGDVRDGTSQIVAHRVGAAIGDGSVAVALVHQYLGGSQA